MGFDEAFTALPCQHISEVCRHNPKPSPLRTCWVLVLKYPSTCNQLSSLHRVDAVAGVSTPERMGLRHTSSHISPWRVNAGADGTLVSQEALQFGAAISPRVLEGVYLELSDARLFRLLQSGFPIRLLACLVLAS